MPTNTEILLAALGYDGGTIHQVSDELNMPYGTILELHGTDLLKTIKLASGKRIERVMNEFRATAVVVDEIKLSSGDINKDAGTIRVMSCSPLLKPKNEP